MTKEQAKRGNGLLTLIDTAQGYLNAISPDKAAKVIGVKVYYDREQRNEIIILPGLSFSAPESLRQTIDNLSDNAASEIKAIVETYYADVINIAEKKLAEL